LAKPRGKQLHRRLAVRRRFRLRPVTRLDLEAGYPVDCAAAVPTVEHPSPEFSFEVRLHLQEFEPEHLHMDDEPVRTAEPGGDRLVHEVVGLDRLLGHGPDGTFEVVAFAARHGADRSGLEGRPTCS
jgi:hypothetical protein